MKEPEKELIKEIVNLFEDYEETYVPGEWEAFARKKAHRLPSFSFWMQIAASIVVILSFLPFSLSDLFKMEFAPTEIGQVPSAKVQRHFPPAVNQLPGFGLGRQPGTETDPVSSSAQGIAAADSSSRNNFAAVSDAASDSLKAPVQQLYVMATPAQVLPQMNSRADDSSTVRRRQAMRTAEFLAGESKNRDKAVKKNKSADKWDFGIVVTPTATGSNMDVGAGLTTAYHLSPKLALSSGISLLQLQSGKSTVAGGDNQVSLLSIPDKSLLAVNTNIKAIDIPLGLVYQVNTHFYTSAGVSFLNIISDKQSSTFSQTSQASMMGTSPSGSAFSYKIVQTSQVNELTPDGTLRGSSYVGFFNFSVGRKQNVFGNYKIQIEPFIKIPIGKLSTEDLQLMNSGVKFQLAF